MPSESTVCAKDLEPIDEVPASRLGPGEMGVLLARAGAGKTACLTHMALGHLLRGNAVLHVCVDSMPDKVKVWYHELLKNLFAGRAGCDVASLQHRIEPFRFIMSFLNQTFGPDKLEQSIGNLREQAKFSPSLLVVDGLDFDKIPRRVFEDIGAIARKHSTPVWMAARMHRHIADVNERGIPYPVNHTDDLFHSILMLEPEGECIRLNILKQNGVYNPRDSELLLDPHTFLLLKRPA